MTNRRETVRVALDAELVRRVRASTPRAPFGGVASYVEHAVAAQLAADARFDAMLREALDATGGPPSRGERARARRLLRGTGSSGAPPR